MALLYITECKDTGLDSRGRSVMAPKMPTELSDYSIPIGISTGQSDPFSGFANFVMLHTDSACCISFGLNPIAVVGVHRLAANETRFYPVTPGHRVAVIASP